MTKKRRTYTIEFKAEAVQMAKDQGFAKTARDLGVAPMSLRNWFDKANPETINDSPDVDWKKEARKLQKENMYLKKINDVLKKSTAIFSQDEFPPFK